MDMRLSSEEAAFYEEVRAFLEAALTPEMRRRAALTSTVFAEPDLALEWQRVLEAKGWLTYHWPREAGGTGWSPIQRYLFEKACADAGAPALPGMGLKLVGPVIYTFGTPDQKARYLTPLRTGEHFWAQGFSEPGAGSDLASLSTRATRQGNEWTINGVKLWTTQAQFATHLFCLARTAPHAKPQAGISFFLIDMDQPGVRVRPILSASGDHEINEVFLDDVRVPDADLVGEPGQGWTIAKFLLQNERGGGTYGPSLVAAIRQAATAIKHLPQARDPLFRDRLARIAIRAEALETTELRILSVLDRGGEPDGLSLATKLLASEIRQDLEQLNFDAYGLLGLQSPAQRPFYSDSAPSPIGSREAQSAAARYLNSRAWSIFGGTSEVQLGLIARGALDL
ncbi:acyl-CoA dehydrogenase family protein [Sphingomonas tabacisoli]|uniref:Acyl-CoA dehydrogenase family protein n=1 Tax=Sphingomonas tabacisoli TaxID=2249466 RepID=A0ABW4I1W8_9SPHN